MWRFTRVSDTAIFYPRQEKGRTTPETAMRLEDRIERRRRRRSETRRLIRDSDALDPTRHPAEPTGRGPALERLLDRLDPAFDGRLPENTYLHGPRGAGKSAVVSALFDRLDAASTTTRSTIHTTTRGASTPTTEFVYVDAREAPSEFALLRSVLAAVVDESVPTQGVGTATLRERLRETLDHDRRVVVAVDHLGEPETVPTAGLDDLFAPVSEALAYVAVGRDPPTDVGLDAASVDVAPYEPHTLADVLAARASDGLARDAVAHETLRAVAEWAEGDAHDALAAVFDAALVAEADDAGRVRLTDVTAARAAVPREGCSLGRVLALSANRRRVLAGLVRLSRAERASVTDAAAAVAAAPGVDLSAATVTRVLYELAERGVVRRVVDDGGGGPGRPPSRPEPNFAHRVFRRLATPAAD
jgi:Cdc6-like AAA superfamily ATPase